MYGRSGHVVAPSLAFSLRRDPSKPTPLSKCMSSAIFGKTEGRGLAVGPVEAAMSGTESRRLRAPGGSGGAFSFLPVPISVGGGTVGQRTQHLLCLWSSSVGGVQLASLSDVSR